jgi:hypothetical protein
MRRKIDGKKRGKGAKSDGKKDGNMHLLKTCKASRKGGKRAKSDGKKERQYAFIRSM